MEDCVLWEGPHNRGGKSVRSPSPAEEVAPETTCDERTTTRGGGSEFMSEIKPWEEERGGGKMF